jgi:hypothetical protein
VKNLETAVSCAECHADLVASGSIVAAPQERWKPASGYMAAMHGLCVTCHEQTLKETPESFPENLTRCAGCHNANHAAELTSRAPYIRETKE